MCFSLCKDGLQGKCLKKMHVDVGEVNWTLSAQNKLGQVELQDRADLTKRGNFTKNIYIFSVPKWLHVYRVIIL